MGCFFVKDMVIARRIFIVVVRCEKHALGQKK